MPDRPFAPLGVEGRDLAINRAGRQVFAGLSFRAPPSALTAVIGPNGSGKSTLLRLVAGLLRPDAGSLSITSGQGAARPNRHNTRPPPCGEVESGEAAPGGGGGEAVTGTSEAGSLRDYPRPEQPASRAALDLPARGRLGMQPASPGAGPSRPSEFGDPLEERDPTRGTAISSSNERIAHYLGHADALKPALSFAETLSFFAAIYGARQSLSELQAAAEAVGLGHAFDLPVGVLSAGQRRRAGLARLLVSPRPLWLLDEPTAALDREGEAVLGRILGAHLADGGTVIAATHGDLPIPPRFKLDLSPPA